MYMNTFTLDVYVHIVHPLLCQDTRVKISSSQKLVHYQRIPGTDDVARKGHFLDLVLEPSSY